jgi:phosphoglycerol transferase MdoB-like AlkP superfamily enzyme
MYYLFFTSFASFSLLETFAQTFTVSDSVVAKLSYKTFVYLIILIIYIVHREILRKKKYYLTVEQVEKRKRILPVVLITGGVLLIISIGMLTKTDLSRLRKQWNREYIVERYGIIIYQCNDLAQTIKTKLDATFGKDKAAEEFINYYNNNTNPKSNNEYTNKLEGYNVIIIHLESMMQFLVGLEINGQEVTPNLNKLTKESMYFDNFYSQVSVGTSSDTELTFNTSLMPTKSGTAFVSYSDRYYISIPKLLKEQGYYAYSMHANNADFWNRRTMHNSLGYDKFIAKADYEVKKENVIGLGLSDKEFFAQSVPKMKKIAEKKEKWYALSIMLSNHTPFSDVTKYGDYDVNIKENVTKEDGTTEEVTYPYMEGTKLGNYFKSIHYADAALGEFITGLDENGLLDNTIIVLYGDHDARLPRKDYNRLYNYDKENDDILDKEDPEYQEYDSYQYELGRKVPFIIWSKDMKGTKYNFENTNVMGMYDAAPTLGNMLGFYNKYSLGHDIFDIKENNIIVYPNGNWLNNKLYYNSQKAAYLPLTEEPINEEDINNNIEYANKILDISNDIIVFDLLNKEKNKEIESRE